jgi:putative membrane protein
MRKHNYSLATATALTGLLALTPTLFAQSTSGSAGGSMGTSSGSMSKPMSGKKMSSSDTKFMKDAAMGGMEEVELGKMAAQKASDADVKSFGQKMVDDHSKANDQLQQLATQKGVTLPTGPSTMQKSDMAKLDKLSGSAFDKAYVSMMVKDHKKDVAEFKKASTSAKDSDLKSWAGTTLPTLQDHLKMVQDISSKMHPTKSAKMSKKSS